MNDALGMDDNLYLLRWCSKQPMRLNYFEAFVHHTRRIVSGVDSLDLFKIARLDFYQPDFERFRCLRLAYDVLHQGGTAPAILNAANEVAVAAFLDRQLPFLGISQLIESILAILPGGPEGSLGDVLAADAEARHEAHRMIKEQLFT